MRIIDADALKESVKKKFKAIPDRCEINGLVNAAPTIDAIPVEWLEKQRDKRRAAAAAHSNISSMTVLEAINVVLELWEKEG